MTSELYNKIVQGRGSFEKLIARIPGFKGYQDKQARRTADTQVREYLADQVQQRVDRLVRIEKLILDNAGMMYMSKTRGVKGQLQLYHDRIATAAPGYSGMWAQMKIGAEELDLIYAFDEAQMQYVDKIDLALEQLQQAALNRDALEAAIYNLDETVREANEAFSLRDDLFTGFSQSV
ncbi:MAG: hypothetical protein OHK0046_06540 [Anaerolineae bacterium]